MVNLKAVRMKIKSITSIQKITKSMKMVSTTKFSRAEQSLNELSRIYTSCDKIIASFDESGDQNSEPTKESKEQEHHKFGALVLLSSDKGLCGQIHSSIFKYARNLIERDPAIGKIPLITIGDRIAALAKNLPNKQIMHFNGIGSQVPSFKDAQYIINRIFSLSNSGMTIGQENEDQASSWRPYLPRLLLIHNKYANMIRFDTLHRSILGPQFMQETAARVNEQFELDGTGGKDDESTSDFFQYLAAYQLYSAMGLAICAEFSSRISCMESSTKNAGELLDKMTVIYNRTRQAAITNELMEIISGASASAKN